MHISVKHFDGQYPSFNILLHTAPDSEPFLEIKGCRIVSGSKGDFISYPSRKDDKGKYWNHVYGGEKFNAHVMKIAQADKPKPQKPPAKAGSGFDDMDDSIPF
jgi:DNA-binding cell septation regulator SpoVG